MSDGTKPSKAIEPEASASNPGTETPMDAAGERTKRLTAEALNGLLARKTCPLCATAGCWHVYNLERGRKRVRYIQCKGCGHKTSVPVFVALTPAPAPPAAAPGAQPPTAGKPENSAP